jgi:hypothetical protein
MRDITAAMGFPKLQYYGTCTSTACSYAPC